jgi:hypothetical protein
VSWLAAQHERGTVRSASESSTARIPGGTGKIGSARQQLRERIVDAWIGGCVLLAGIQLPGAVLDFIQRRDVKPPQVWLAAVIVVAAISFAVRRVLLGSLRARLQFFAAIPPALVLTGALAELAPVVMSLAVKEVPDLGILVPAQGGPYHDCRGSPRRCTDYTINELGFRGTLTRPATPNTRIVAFVGDSFVFGSGVPDDATVPSVVGRALADEHPTATTLNAGIPIVVLLKDDDLDDTDVLSRWTRFRRSIGYRMLYVANIEPIFEIVRVVWRQRARDATRVTRLVTGLDKLVESAGDARLVIMAQLSNDVTSAYVDWMRAHPGVRDVRAWEEPRFANAERIPGDGHWTEAGCADVAAVTIPVTRVQLAARAP